MQGVTGITFNPKSLDCDQTLFFKDDNSHLQRVGFVRNYLQNLRLEWMDCPGITFNLNPIHGWISLGLLLFPQ